MANRCQRRQLPEETEDIGQLAEVFFKTTLDMACVAEAEAHASVGALLIGESAVTWEQVFESADKAMYDAKGQGGDCVVVG